MCWLLLAAPALAQPTRYDVAEFVIPAGFTAKPEDGQLELTHIDQGRGFSLQVVLYPARASLGSPAKDFASEWQQTVAASFTADEVPAPVASKLEAQVPLFEGGSNASSSSGSRYAHLYLLRWGGKILTVMVVASNRGAFDTMRPTLARFFQGLRLPAAAAPPAVLAAVPKRGEVKWTGAPIVGIWMGFKDVGDIELSPVTGDFNLYVSKHALRWRTFLADGSSFEGLPRNGLLSLELTQARADPDDGRFWGTWTVAGAQVTARQPSGRLQVYRLDGDTLREDAKTTGHATFWRARSVDGLKLEGTWSSFVQWDESQSGPNWTSAPVISFTRAGRFVDRGALMWSTIDPLTAQNAERHPGQGTYEINGYTLVLRYEDGREVQRPFMGAMKKDPARDASVIFVGKFPFYRQ